MSPYLNNKTGSLLLWMLLMACFEKSPAQDINFSQFYEMPMLRNPSLAGLFKGDVRAAASYRNQWASVTVPYVTEAFGTEIRMPVSSVDYVTAGIQLSNDQAGDSKLGRTQILPVAAFLKCLNHDRNTYLCFGVTGGAVQQRFDPSQLKFDDQFVNGTYSEANATQQTFGTTGLLYWDLSAGLTFSTDIGNSNVYVGSALFHIPSPRVAFNTANDFRIDKKIVFNAGADCPAGDGNTIILYGDYFRQGGNHQAQGGALFSRSLQANEETDEGVAIGAGLFYRGLDAFIPVVKLEYYKTSVSVSYDVNASKLTPASYARGGLEVVLVYRDFLERYDTDTRKTRCPARF